MFDHDILTLSDGTTRINVLDKGYVRKLWVQGTDMSVVNAARVSFDKEVTELKGKDKKLIKFLWEHGHTSPFRHAMFSLEVYAPLMIARQWWKYVVGSDHTFDGWNESSRRYVTENNKFYVVKPGQWRAKPDNAKQGSGDFIDDVELSERLSDALLEHYETSENLYNQALAAGVAPEQARLFLPANGLYARWRWTGSLQSGMHFLQQRLAHGAQHEISQYASAVCDLLYDEFPISIQQILEVNNE